MSIMTFNSKLQVTYQYCIMNGRCDGCSHDGSFRLPVPIQAELFHYRHIDSHEQLSRWIITLDSGFTICVGFNQQGLAGPYWTASIHVVSPNPQLASKSALALISSCAHSSSPNTSRTAHQSIIAMFILSVHLRSRRSGLCSVGVTVLLYRSRSVQCCLRHPVY